MHVLILGATGRTGRHAVREALSRGHRVKAFARDTARLGLEHARLALFTGDLADAGAVSGAVHGCEAVLCCAGARSPLHRYEAFTRGVRNVLQAMQASGVERLVYQSFLGVAGGRRQLRLPFKLLVRLALPGSIADHEENETHIRASGLVWTIVRPPKLTDHPARGDWRSGDDVIAAPFPTIARADVAAFMLEQLVSSRYQRQSPAILRGDRLTPRSD